MLMLMMMMMMMMMKMLFFVLFCFLNIEHDKAIDFVVVASHLRSVPELEIFLGINLARQSKKKRILV